MIVGHQVSLILLNFLNYLSRFVGYLGTPRFIGSIPGFLDKFDAEFFGYSEAAAHQLEASARMLLEKTWEALWDAGIDPRSLRGTKTGYFVGNCYQDASVLQKTILDTKYFNLVQFHSSRVPFTFDFRGPNVEVDTACASSLSALNELLLAMASGECDVAILAASNLFKNPKTAFAFHDMTMTSPDCACKTFDESANGYGRSEAIGVLVLQWKRSAKRSYCTVLDTLTSCDGYKPEGITFPKWETQAATIIESLKRVRDKNYL